jgi:hypothetical protein
MKRLLVALLAAMAVMPAVASAQVMVPDSDAPAGAPANWLPSESWVMERWTPFDQDRLFAILRMDREQVFQYIYNHSNLEALAKKQGVPTKGLAARLLANRKSHVSPHRYKVLLERANRMLSQRHLAEHVIHHPWHVWAIQHHIDEIYGMGALQMLLDGMPFESLSQHVTIPPDVLRARLLERLDADARRGVKVGAITVREQRRLGREARANMHDLFMPAGTQVMPGHMMAP